MGQNRCQQPPFPVPMFSTSRKGEERPPAVPTPAPGGACHHALLKWDSLTRSGVRKRAASLVKVKNPQLQVQCAPIIKFC